MKIFDNLRGYILEDEFKITIFKDKINIQNYIDIGNFDSNKVEVKHQNGLVLITGGNLIVSRLMNNEILINGVIKNIEMR